MAWYDTFSTFYDQSLERLYALYRAQAVARLAPEPGQVVLLPACGTGQDLDGLLDALGPDGHVLAVDVSQGMLDRAAQRVERLGAAGRVTLLRRDVRELDVAAVVEDLGRAVDHALLSLGLTVVPEWQAVLRATVHNVRPGGRIVIFDVHASSWVPQTTLVQLMARADLSRRPWEALQDLCDDVQHELLDGSPHTFGGTPYLTSGVRRADGARP